jgi:hypothetical protein
MRFSESHFPYGSFVKTTRVLLKASRGELEDTWGLLDKASRLLIDQLEYLSVFWTGNLLRGVPEVDECGLAEIGNSNEETHGTQFGQVRAARCVIPYVLYAA